MRSDKLQITTSTSEVKLLQSGNDSITALRIAHPGCGLAACFCVIRTPRSSTQTQRSSVVPVSAAVSPNFWFFLFRSG